MANDSENYKAFFGEPIYTYTRAQAIEDGVLLDVSEMAREAGFKYPVAITERLFEEVVNPPAIAVEQGESESGRLWDVLWMLRMSIGKASNRGSDIREFEVIATDEHNRKQTHQLWSRCHAGDDPQPVITIMMRGED